MPDKTLTVGELIVELHMYDPDEPVYTMEERDCLPITGVFRLVDGLGGEKIIID